MLLYIEGTKIRGEKGQKYTPFQNALGTFDTYMNDDILIKTNIFSPCISLK